MEVYGPIISLSTADSELDTSLCGGVPCVGCLAAFLDFTY